MFQLHRATILNYEALYGENPDGTSGTRNMIALANTSYNLSGVAEVDTLTQALTPAYTAFITYANSLHGTGAPDIDQSIISNAAAIYFRGDDAAAKTLDARVDDARSGNNLNNNLLVGGAGGDHLYGGTGLDYLLGNAGSDTLDGGNDNDTLIGGAGNDALLGGAGTDSYILNTGDGADTITDSDGLGKILLNNTPLAGTATKATPAAAGVMQWVDGSTTYLFTPTSTGSKKGKMVITSGTESVTINNFDLTIAADPAKGYLGIKLTDQVGVATGTSTTAPAPTDQTASVPVGNIQTITLYALVGNTVQLACTGSGTYQCSTGANLLSFAGGPITLTIPAGQDSVTVTLIDTTNTNTPDTATLTATLVDAGGNTVTSNTLAVTFNNPNPLVGVTPTPHDNVVDASLYINQGAAPGTAGNDLIDLSTLNGTTNPGSGAPYNAVDATQGGADTIIGGGGIDMIALGNGNNVVHLGGGMDYLDSLTNTAIPIYIDGNNLISGGSGSGIIRVGNGDNRIYADAQVDLATALANQKTPTVPATGQQGYLLAVGDGDNTLVGGSGRDAIFTGAGNNTVVMGAGGNIFVGGVQVTGTFYVQAMYDLIPTIPAATHLELGASSYIAGTLNGRPYPVANDQLVNPAGNYVNFAWMFAESIPYVAPANYHGSTFNDAPVGLGNNTIFGGTGNDFYLLSNGDNWLDAGGGNDYIHAGAGHNTIFTGTGNCVVYGGGGTNFINLETGNNYVVLQGGNNIVVGDSGDNIIVSGDAGMSDVSRASETTANNYIYGGSGNTTIVGSGGNDILLSGSQAGTGKHTTILAGDGTQYIVGGAGNDVIIGGAGTNTIYAGDGDTTIQLSGNANETSSVYGGGGTNVIIGGAGNDVIYSGDGGAAIAYTYVSGGDGDDLLVGGEGYAILLGGTGTDTLIAGGGTSYLQGGSGTSIMYASTGNATLVGGSGSNTMYGGHGTDVLQGGSGSNLFVAGMGNETIIAGSGSNTYEFNAGFGNVVLVGAKSSDTFVFGRSGFLCRGFYLGLK